jgi:GNAT superfamily N-acetyltransferase
MTLSLTYKYLADEPEQIDLCAKWAFNAWGKYNPAVTLKIRQERFTAHCNKNKLPLTIICKSDNKMIGMASLRANDGIGEELSPWLGSLYVSENFRGSGIGASLIKRIENEASQLKYKVIYLLTYETTLPQWYASKEWKKVRDDILLGNPIVIMEKQL